MEDWAEIRRLHRAEGMPIKVSARTLGISRNTVRSEGATGRRSTGGSRRDPFAIAVAERQECMMIWGEIRRPW